MDELTRVLDALAARDRDDELRDDVYAQARAEVLEILDGPGAMKLKLDRVREWAGGRTP